MSTPDVGLPWGSYSEPPDQELHALLTEPDGRPEDLLN